MRKKLAKNLILISGIILLNAYVLSYFYQSYLGKLESYSGENGKEWSFAGTRMEGEKYCVSCTTFKPEYLEAEEKLCRLYYPLVKLDALLTKDEHIFAGKVSACS